MSRKRKPKTRKVAIWPDGPRFVIYQDGQKMWHYGRGHSGYPQSGTLADFIRYYGGQVIVEPNPDWNAVDDMQWQINKMFGG